ncbi:hypothetical protein PZA11_005790 [Diplocarpon coronariae]|uniref:HIG1 domain-containing protein n=1 Tax=Diplocarpon coronariae TaxID=2795749 RepID=A0A218Z2X5_9HELO|nr:hypothetical protein B2J93_3229 [Marssonina coronariae]
MKILTKEEEDAHYATTVKGGLTGGAIGLAVGAVALYGGTRRFQLLRGLTIPMKAYLVSATGTFSAIICADRASRGFELERHPNHAYVDNAARTTEALEAGKTSSERLKDWGRENRYPIVTASWVASMGIALGLVGRNPYLSRAQKLVQARVYAQGLTLAILIATAVLEVGDASRGKGRWETVKILDPDDPEHKHVIEKRIHHEAYEGEDLWRDMVEAEERKIAARKQATAHASHEHPPAKQAKGQENKDQISHESKSAGKVDYAAAAAMEKKTQERQAEKEADARKSAPADGAKVKDRGEY